MKVYGIGGARSTHGEIKNAHSAGEKNEGVKRESRGNETWTMTDGGLLCYVRSLGFLD
jgi:hypothetical protein